MCLLKTHLLFQKIGCPLYNLPELLASHFHFLLLSVTSILYHATDCHLTYKQSSTKKINNFSQHISRLLKVLLNCLPRISSRYVLYSCTTTEMQICNCKKVLLNRVVLSVYRKFLLVEARRPQNADVISVKFFIISF